MKKNNCIVYSDCDSLALSVIECVPDTVEGIVQISHGMAEHKERYLPFMQYLCDHNFACVIHDHRGHGKSVKSSEDLGYFYEDHADYIVEDLRVVSSHLREEYPDVPFILFGHSMGSLVVRKYLQKYDDSLDRLIVCGSPSQNSACSFAIFLVKLLEKIYNSHYRSQLIESLSTGPYNRGYIHENEWLSKNPDNVEDYNADPLCGFRFTLNGYKNLFTLLRDVYSNRFISKKNLDLPILFIAGKDDPVIVSDKKFNAAIDFLKKQGYTNVSGKLFDGLRHEILNEKEHDIVYKYVIDFIK